MATSTLRAGPAREKLSTDIYELALEVQSLTRRARSLADAIVETTDHFFPEHDRDRRRVIERIIDFARLIEDAVEGAALKAGNIELMAGSFRDEAA
jgi:hypothetical protein